MRTDDYDTTDDASVLRALRELLADRGKVSLAEAGEALRRANLSLPEPHDSMSQYAASTPELVLSGRPSHRKLSLAADTTEAALVRLVVEVLRSYDEDSMPVQLLKQRISERGRFVPGLLALLRRHATDFDLGAGGVRLRPTDGSAGAAPLSLVSSAPLAPMSRLRSLSLETEMTLESLPPPSCVDEVIVIDMDNKAFLLEPSAAYAARDGVECCRTLVLGFCARSHNPRVSPAAAASLRALSSAGWLRLLSPQRDTANAADVVLAFWVGWLHAQLPSCRFTLLSTDIHLERTVADVLRAQGRRALSNPDSLLPGCAPEDLRTFVE